MENEADGPAAAVVDALVPALPFPVHFEVEPRPGIPYARNTAIAAVKDRVDFIAFLDDDEEPEPQWLRVLFDVLRAHDADVVTGPVLCRLPAGASEVLERGKFFVRPRFKTGTVRDRAFTGNVMYKVSIFDRFWPPFDESMAMTGGSDAQFSAELFQGGYKIVWADEATVHEDIPADRAQVGWLVRRALRVGGQRARVDFDQLSKLHAGARWTVRMAESIGLGVVDLPMCVFGRHWAIRSLLHFSQAAGRLGAVLGVVYEEYKR